MLKFPTGGTTVKKLFICCTILSALMLCAAQERYITLPPEGLEGHIQGVAADETGIYWSHTTSLLKTDYEGKILASVKVPSHAGSLCVTDGKLFVSMALRGTKILNEHEKCRSWIFEFDSTTLEPVKKHKHPELTSPDGITFHDGKFYIAKGFPREPHPVNEIIIYDRNFKLLETRKIDIGQNTMYGAQMLAVVDGKLLAGFYGDKKKKGYFFELNDFTNVIGTFPVRGSFGLAELPVSVAGEKRVFIIAEVTGKRPNWGARVRVVKYENGKLTPFHKPLNTSK